jgi:hypothetical protein
MFQVGFQPMTPVFERGKTVHCLYIAVTMLRNYFKYFLIFYIPQYLTTGLLSDSIKHFSILVIYFLLLEFTHAMLVTYFSCRVIETETSPV